MQKVVMKCQSCDGDGWTLDVEPGHADDCRCWDEDAAFSTCPVPVQVQVMCEACEGTGMQPVQ